MRGVAALIVLAVVGVALPAAAQDGPKAARGAVQAGKDLESYIGKTAAAKEKLNLSAPPAAPLFARVFDNKTLVAIARTMPTTLTELSRISGVGPAKLERYGEAVITLLAAHA